MAVGIKDSSGDPDMLEERKAFPDKEVFAGTDGPSSIMSGANNIIPDIVTEIYANYETDTGAAEQDRLDQIRRDCLGSPPLKPLRLGCPATPRPAGHPSIDHRRRKNPAPISPLSACRRRKWPRAGASPPSPLATETVTTDRVVVKDTINRVTGETIRQIVARSAVSVVWRAREARLQKPLKRTGPKGSGTFTEISWDEALGEIASHLNDLIEAGRAHEILTAHYTGTCSVIANQFPMRFFHHIGATEIEPFCCNLSGHVALGYVW